MNLDLVFKGGGGKCSCYIGALRAILSRGHTINLCVGTSAGAITAALVAKGYSPDQIQVLTQEKDSHGKSLLAGFLDGDKWLMALELWKQFGINPGDAATDWLKSKLGEYTFETWPGLDLSICATDLNDHELIVFNKRTSPNVPVHMAVRASMSIPGVFVPVRWDSSWGLYRGRKKDSNYLVDGGCLSNAPLRLLTEFDADTLDIMGPIPGTHAPVCLYLDDPGSSHFSTFAEFLGSVLSTMENASDDSTIRAHAEMVCELDTCGIGTLEFSVPADVLAAANQKSYDRMRQHLIGRGL